MGTYMMSQILNIWDATGHIEYHVTHGILLGTDDSKVQCGQYRDCAVP